MWCFNGFNRWWVLIWKAIRRVRSFATNEQLLIVAAMTNNTFYDGRVFAYLLLIHMRAVQGLTDEFYRNISTLDDGYTILFIALQLSMYIKPIGIIGLNVLSMLAPNIGLRAHIFDHHLSTCITSVCIWIQLVDCCQCRKFRHRYRYDWKFNSETTNDNKWIPSSDKTSVETPCASILTPLIQTEYKNTIHEQQFYWLNESLVSAKNTHAQAHHTIYK